MNDSMSTGQKAKFNSTLQLKDSNLQNYKGQFYGNKDEADSHNHEFGAHFKIKDLVKRLENVQKENKRSLEIEESNEKLKKIDATTTKFLKLMGDSKFNLTNSIETKNNLNSTKAANHDTINLNTGMTNSNTITTNTKLKKNHSVNKFNDFASTQKEVSYYNSMVKSFDKSEWRNPKNLTLSDINKNESIDKVLPKHFLSPQNNLQVLKPIMEVKNDNIQDSNEKNAYGTKLYNYNNDSISTKANSLATQNLSKDLRSHLPQLTNHNMEYNNNKDIKNTYTNMLNNLQDKLNIDSDINLKSISNITRSTLKSISNKANNLNNLYKRGSESINARSKKINYIEKYINKSESVDKQNFNQNKIKLPFTLNFNSNLNSSNNPVSSIINEKFAYQGRIKNNDFLQKAEPIIPQNKFRSDKNVTRIVFGKKFNLPSLNVNV